MGFKKLILLAAVQILLLTGCIPENTVLPGKTSYEVVISNHRFTPAVWRVPAGESITMDIANQEADAHDVTILLRPITSSTNEANVYFRQTLDPKKTTILTFTAPKAPGEYRVISSLPGDAENGFIARLVVVQVPDNQ